ncbi:hypothetical protein [Anaeromicrobium sediminis]|uniref:Uncharacterized protein n=1 Tax=Anaeromicrobium sediminis TaxID=1478221 RepID=A0A267MDU4_9FIRM|nr:hypothetical protein [Anaeromicrobium sediminis]PAB57035.1 hypothetical protein CCE28_19845 [Anaeromicrobium sediminis]
MEKNARQNVEDSLNKLNQVESDLTNAVEMVENPNAKKKMKKVLRKVNNMTNSMEGITNQLSDDTPVGGIH